MDRKRYLNMILSNDFSPKKERLLGLKFLGQLWVPLSALGMRTTVTQLLVCGRRLSFKQDTYMTLSHLVDGTKLFRSFAGMMPSIPKLSMGLLCSASAFTLQIIQQNHDWENIFNLPMTTGAQLQSCLNHVLRTFHASDFKLQIKNLFQRN